MKKINMDFLHAMTRTFWAQLESGTNRQVQILSFFLMTFFVLACVSNKEKEQCRCRPNESCWPKEQNWEALRQVLKGQLVRPKNPLDVCKESQSPECKQTLKEALNPFYLSDNVGATQSTGWENAWKAAVSTYAVVAESTEDISNAIKFARKYNLRLVVKGTGHDYLGRSNAPDSLLIWTHKMRKVSIHKSFVASGCNPSEGKPAVSAMAGAMWIDAYREVTTKHGRYVQGGGCTSVGVAGGFLQGGGFGSWSKKFGTAASNLIEAEVVLASGQTVIANDCQNQDLFWALKGGGGGTFGVVSRVTLVTHDLPKRFGIVVHKIKATNDKDFKKLIGRFLNFYKQKLHNEHWGEQAKFRPSNSLELLLTFQGLSKKEVERIWLPFKKWLKAHPKSYQSEFQVVEVPGQKIWDANYWQKTNPDAIEIDRRPNQPKGQFYWKGDAGQVSMYWFSYQSRWIPETFFLEKNIQKTTDILFNASRHQFVALHFNKALAGAASDARDRSRKTPMNPVVHESAALAIIAEGRKKGYIDIKAYQPDPKKAEQIIQRVNTAMGFIKRATPRSGSYVNETDYFEEKWQESFWGENYERLLSIKTKYDPEGLFYCHHCVGSEAWNKNGMCRSR